MHSTIGFLCVFCMGCPKKKFVYQERGWVQSLFLINLHYEFNKSECSLTPLPLPLSTSSHMGHLRSNSLRINIGRSRGTDHGDGWMIDGFFEYGRII